MKGMEGERERYLICAVQKGKTKGKGVAGNSRVRICICLNVFLFFTAIPRHFRAVHVLFISLHPLFGPPLLSMHAMTRLDRLLKAQAGEKQGSNLSRGLLSSVGRQARNVSNCFQNLCDRNKNMYIKKYSKKSKARVGMLLNGLE